MDEREEKEENREQDEDDDKNINDWDGNQRNVL